LKNINPKFNVLIDSTGLKNDYNVFITAISNHNGRISNEIRLILVVDKISGYPIYYKFVPGNIVDVNTFVSINNKLKELNININHAVLDAGYYSEENLRELVSYNIPFLIRLIPKRTMYEELVSKHVQNLQKKEYYVKHGNRVLFIKKCKKIS
jgi:transposase